nr:hypothetical protein [Tanacetum cinerariifolium]
ALPPPDYMPGPEEPEQAPPSSVYIPYVPELVYPEADRPEVTLPPQKRLSIVHCPGYEAGESSVAAATRPIEGRRADYGFVDSVEAEIRRQRAEDIGYGIRDTWIDPRDVVEEEALTTLEGVNTRVTELATVQEQDTQDIYGVMEDTQGRQTEIFQRVKALVDDSQYHYETGRLVDQEARCSREAWTYSIGLTRDANQTGDDNHTSGTVVRRTERVTRECTYQDFMKCQPLYFKGALTWWNSHVRIVCNDAAYVMTWIELKKKMSDKVEKYIGSLPDSIHGSVAASKPKTMQEATEMATGLMDKKIRTYAERRAANKRKFEDTSRNNHGRQQPPKRQDVARAYVAGS